METAKKFGYTASYSGDTILASGPLGPNFRVVVKIDDSSFEVRAQQFKKLLSVHGQTAGLKTIQDICDDFYERINLATKEELSGKGFTLAPTPDHGVKELLEAFAQRLAGDFERKEAKYSDAAEKGEAQTTKEVAQPPEDKTSERYGNPLTGAEVQNLLESGIGEFLRTDQDPGKLQEDARREMKEWWMHIDPTKIIKEDQPTDQENVELEDKVETSDNSSESDGNSDILEDEDSGTACAESGKELEQASKLVAELCMQGEDVFQPIMEGLTAKRLLKVKLAGKTGPRPY